MIRLSKQVIFQLLLQSRKAIKRLGVKRLGLFGSYIRQEETPESDIDILVEFEPGKKTYDNFINLSFFLEDALKKKVELVTPKALSPYMKSHILKEVDYLDFK